MLDGISGAILYVYLYSLPTQRKPNISPSVIASMKKSNGGKKRPLVIERFFALNYLLLALAVGFLLNSMNSSRDHKYVDTFNIYTSVCLFPTIVCLADLRLLYVIGNVFYTVWIIHL